VSDEQNPNPNVMVSGEPDTRDLGFGSVVSQEQKTRLLNRDGSFNVHRHGLKFGQQLNSYHALLTMRWWKFNTLLAVAFFVFNLFFAWVYILCGHGSLRGDESHNPFTQAFLFSVETFSTVGYGNVVPANKAANIVMVIEIFVGLASVAIATGLIFARFSRPTAEIIYSKIAVIAPYLGKTGFMFRMTNARQNQIIDLTARVIMSRFERVDGTSQRKYHTLKLERDVVAFFPLAWTVVHPITPDSPLYGWDEEMLRSSAAEFLVLLTGIDETFAQTVHSRTSYVASEVLWNAKFVSIFEDSTDGVAINVAKLDNIEPAPILAKDKTFVQ
jgi:inward rectifier potassium channel